MDHAAGTLALQIEVQITCICSVWGMQTSVESMMVTQAEESMQKFLAWAKQRCTEFKQVWSLWKHAFHDLECCISDLGCYVGASHSLLFFFLLIAKHPIDQ